MNRSGSQKVLLVISIINIVSGVFALIGALMSLLMGGAVSGATLLEIERAGVTVNDALAASAALSIVGVASLILGAIALLEGILGIRAANDKNKIMPVWVLSIIGLGISVLAFVASIFNGSFGANLVSNLCSLVGSGLMFWIANNIKVETGK